MGRHLRRWSSGKGISNGTHQAKCGSWQCGVRRGRTHGGCGHRDLRDSYLKPDLPQEPIPSRLESVRRKTQSHPPSSTRCPEARRTHPALELMAWTSANKGTTSIQLPQLPLCSARGGGYPSRDTWHLSLRRKPGHTLPLVFSQKPRAGTQ